MWLTLLACSGDVLEELRWEIDVCVGEQELAAEAKGAELARIEAEYQQTVSELEDQAAQVRPTRAACLIRCVNIPLSLNDHAGVAAAITPGRNPKHSDG